MARRSTYRTPNPAGEQPTKDSRAGKPPITPVSFTHCRSFAALAGEAFGFSHSLIKEASEHLSDLMLHKTSQDFKTEEELYAKVQHKSEILKKNTSAQPESKQQLE